jgi:diguanylate cyclase (GGDEF)-like protein
MNINKCEHILLVTDPQTKQTIYLEAPFYSLGRHSNSSIRIHSQEVSRHHASLIRKDFANNKSSYLLIDGNLEGKRSQNGILVNGRKKLSHELKHGDIISFGAETVKAIYQIKLIGEDKNSFHQQHPDSGEEDVNESKYIKDHLSREQIENTLIISEQNLQDKLKNADLSRLASFPELSPNPIIELDFLGNITYTNQAANLNFANIEELKLKHPLLSGLVLETQDPQGKFFTREVKIGENFYEQYIHYLSANKLIRSYIFDITERKHSEEMLRYQASHDSLTGLPNRDFFYQQLSQSIAKLQQINQQLALLFIDLDRFKNINDTLSHSTGDQLLQNFTYRLLSCLKENQILSRWGGDEFILILTEIDSGAEVSETAKIIMDTLKEPFYLDKHKIYISSSIGIAIYPQDAEDEETLIKNADAALYRAKELGRNNYQFYSPQINVEFSWLFKLENSLYHALESNQFLLNYQPQMNLKTKKIEGLEALIRWQHPEFGKISPVKFIPLAEETGLIIPIGEWVLETACYQNKAWQDAGLPAVTVAVNLSARQFQQKNLAAKIAEILEKTQLKPHLLELEITESILIQNVESAQKIINELLELGVSIALDDFGTGYSSLAYLKQFPFHIMKIDQSFVRDLSDNPQNIALVSAIIAIGRSFNMRVLAEGVENIKQLELLENLECEIIQGYWLSCPLPSEDIPQFFSEHNLEKLI